MQRIMPARVSVLICEVKRRKAFKRLILLRFPIHGAIAYAGGGCGLYDVFKVSVYFKGVSALANRTSNAPPGEVLSENAVPARLI
jgi:hypothetical protein